MDKVGIIHNYLHARTKSKLYSENYINYFPTVLRGGLGGVKRPEKGDSCAENWTTQ
jgi:hypothetical protein